MTPDVLLAVAAGGGIGATARHLLNNVIILFMGTDFPFHTLAANVGGSLIMGLLVQAMATIWEPSIALRSFLTVGVLGGFTTFSTFSLDTAVLVESGAHLPALTYVLTSVLASIGALFSGLYLGRMLFLS